MVTKETKPFFKTSEFWGSLLAFVPLFLNMVDVVDLVPDKYAALASAIVAGLYSISRGAAKSGVSYTPDDDQAV